MNTVHATAAIHFGWILAKLVGLCLLSGCADRALSAPGESKPDLFDYGPVVPINPPDADPPRPPQPPEPCPEIGKPAPAAVVEMKRRVLLFTAEWCPPCRPIIDVELPALAGTGWKIGDGPENHIQVVDIERDVGQMKAYGVTAIPACVLINNGVTIGRLPNAQETRITRWTIGALYNGTVAVGSARRVGSGILSLQSGYAVRFTDDPRRAGVIQHLLTEAEHRGKFTAAYLNGLSYAELSQLHNDDHASSFASVGMGRRVRRRGVFAATGSFLFGRG